VHLSLFVQAFPSTCSAFLTPLIGPS
jgi:hypothetical protein